MSTDTPRTDDNPAVAYLRNYNAWRLSDDERTMDDAGVTPQGVTAAIDGIIDSYDKLERDLARVTAELNVSEREARYFRNSAGLVTDQLAAITSLESAEARIAELEAANTKLREMFNELDKERTLYYPAYTGCTTAVKAQRTRKATSGASTA